MTNNVVIKMKTEGPHPVKCITFNDQFFELNTNNKNERLKFIYYIFSFIELFI